jgi:type IV secretory pathway VirB10-like protein
MKVQYKNETDNLVNIRGLKIKPGGVITSHVFIKHFDDEAKKGNLVIYVDGTKIGIEDAGTIETDPPVPAPEVTKNLSEAYGNPDETKDPDPPEPETPDEATEEPPDSEAASETATENAENSVDSETLAPEAEAAGEDSAEESKTEENGETAAIDSESDSLTRQEDEGAAPETPEASTEEAEAEAAESK